MRAKVKCGNSILFTSGCSNRWDNIKDYMVINFMNKYVYESFRQSKNHLYIDTSEGVVDIVFGGDVPTLEFYEYEKDQLVLKVKNQ